MSVVKVAYAISNNGYIISNGSGNVAFIVISFESTSGIITYYTSQYSSNQLLLTLKDSSNIILNATFTCMIYGTN